MLAAGLEDLDVDEDNGDPPREKFSTSRDIKFERDKIIHACPLTVAGIPLYIRFSFLR